MSTERSAVQLGELTRLNTDLRVVIRSAYPLAEAPAAHRQMETGHGYGKIVVTV